MWYFVADWHLNHGNIIKYKKRPFMTSQEEDLCYLVDQGCIPPHEFKISYESIQAMNETIIENTNAFVRNNDHLVINGDLFFSKQSKKLEEAKKFREMINCENVYVILGNHDDRNVLSPYFKVFDQYRFNIDGQQVFCCHYPCRSWDMASYGSWMLYGHVHGSLSDQDCGKLTSYEAHVYNEEFTKILKKHGNYNSGLVDELLAACSTTRGIDFTLDVGVDNPYRADKVPFGTPWSMEEITEYMQEKKEGWKKRNSFKHQN